MLALIIFSIISSSLFLQAPAVAENINGNQRFESFNQVKKILEKDIVFDHRFTLYCQAPFKANKQIILPEGFQTTTSHKKRATRIEWEHVVPAENFGRFFTEWREVLPIVLTIKEDHLKAESAQRKPIKLSD